MITISLNFALAEKITLKTFSAKDLKNHKFVSETVATRLKSGDIQKLVLKEIWPNGKLQRITELDLKNSKPSILKYDHKQKNQQGYVKYSSPNLEISKTKKSKLVTKKFNFDADDQILFGPYYAFFIQKNWDKLKKTELKFYIPVPDRLSYYTFKIKHKQSTKLANENIDIFEMYASSLLIDIFIGSTYFYFKSDTKEFVRVDAQTRLKDSSGKMIVDTHTVLDRKYLPN